MKHLKFLFPLSFVLALVFAFSVNASSKPATSNYGYYHPSGLPICISGPLDFGATCDPHWYGQICTVDGNTAYESYELCATNFSLGILRKPF
jgi:hypothetical protein